MSRMMFYRRQAIAAVSGGICAVLRGVSSALAQAVIGRGERSGSKEALLIPRRRLFADPAKSVVRISPDRRRIAWLAPLDGVLNLFVAPLDDVGEARAYLGSTGFEKAFVNAANLEWASKMHDDLIDAVDWAVARGIADAKRVAIYGGYAAPVGVTLTPEKFACAIDVFGISNLLTFIATVPDYWKPWQTVWKVRMGDYTTEAGRTFLGARSPLNHVDRIMRPLLTAQGENDVRVKPQESNQIVTAMQARNIPVTYVYDPDEGHGFRREENRRSFNAVLELFLAKHLGGRAEPVGDDFAGSSLEFRAGRDLIPGLDEASRNIPMGMHHDP